MSRPSTHVRKGDQVEVISGGHKGSKGAVLQVFPTKGTALVEGVRLITKATKPNQQGVGGGLIKKEGPIHVSNLKVSSTAAVAPAKKAAKKVAKKK